MKTGIIGFGRAGRSVSSILLESKKTNLQWVLRRSHNLEHRSVPELLGIPSDEPGRIHSIEEFTAEELLDQHPVEVIVDFSSEEGIDFYGEAAAARGITIVSAISNYSQEKIDQLKRLARRTKVLYSPNITLGVNFLMIAARVLKNIAPHTDIEILEEHFKNKKDISGTARTICKTLDLPESAIKTVRAGGIIGVHEVIFGFPHQTVRLKHESIGREAFGNGVLFALENLPKKAGLYSMEDLLMPYFAMSINRDGIVIRQSKPWWKFW